DVARAYKSWTSLLNWSTYNGSSLWAAEGGDFSTVGDGDPGEFGLNEGASVLTAERGAQPGWWEFSGYDLRSVVQGWVTGEFANQGLIVKLKDDKSRVCNASSCTNRAVEFHSSASPDPSLRPYLQVVYYPPAPSTSKVISPREGAVTGRRLKLQAGWSVQGTTGVSFQYKVLGTGTKFKTIPTSFVRKANGDAVSWPLAVQGNQSEAVYFDAHEASKVLGNSERKVQVRALFEGSLGAAGYSTPVNTIVNPNAGGAFDATAAVGPGSVNLLTGNFTIGRTDVSIPVFSTALEFSRTYSSRTNRPVGDPDESSPHDTGVLGWGWQPTVPVEAAGGSSWQKVRDASAAGEGAYAVLTDLEGYEYGFELAGTNYVSPPGATGWVLSRLSSTQLALTDPSGSRTVFEKEPNGFDYRPVAVSQAGDATNTTRMVYQLIGGKRRLSMVIGPAAGGIECTEATAASTAGCRALTFTYQPATTWGAPAAYGDRLSTITFHNSTAQGDQEVARYAYNSEGRLVAEWDPRISPALKETYAYGPGGPMKTLTPPGEEPWSFEYAPMEGEGTSEGNMGRLVKVRRASLLSSPSVAEQTIVYGVPVSGSGAPYGMGAETVAQWGQQDIPTDATAVFPPDQVPSSPPSSYSRATVYYMDAEGMAVNTATPSGAGTSAPSITTSETDVYGNVVRELSAQNRLRALAAGGGSVAKSKELDTHRTFNADGTEMHEEWGPLHEVRLESGATVQARRHVTVEYEPPNQALPAGTPLPHLPTRETVGASIPGQGLDADQRVTETKYNWMLRKPTDTIVDPLGLNLRTHIEYNTITGLPVERRLPANPDGGDARTTKIVYYTPAGHPTDAECGNNPAWSRLPCKIAPAAQPGTAGQPQLLVKRFTAYNALGQPTEVRESPGGGTQNVRKTLLTYDAAGRPLTSSQTGDGAP
ncbi:MAG TPA: DUF6531 domain-containing protein, partial [Solirubrobacterales bacterium]|nr:DUF6531 domain-containing protein [Solirubrobacterales bacterium]